MRIEELDYDLPPDRIATTPVQPRDAARLMVIHRRRNHIEHRHVRDLPQLLHSGDLMIFNHSRVLPAYLVARRAATGGKVTGLYLNAPIPPASAATTDADTPPEHWHILLESRGTLGQGEHLILDDHAQLELADRLDNGQWRARLHADADTLTVLSRVGSTPLPHYIRRARRAMHQPEVNAQDAVHYNTVYGRDPGSVAAPTAGLHFTPELLDSLDRTGIQRAALTLHIGLGTFAPVRTCHLEDHRMHPEWFSTPAETLEAIRAARGRGGRIIPVGTTSVRALESLPQPLPDTGPYAAVTDLCITPPPPDAPHAAGFSFRFTDALLTNFHLPRSTLLALVAALPGVGIDQLKHWYRIAIDKQYRFYSYGDAMLIL
ncbi:MAG: tRNA preQ1(34) S-adenosylmethionine ribosyltransferase-isomerase QueA [Phycisphaeraceae bacterium]